MAWATPRTWGATDVATAAQLNQDVRDNFLHLRGDGGSLYPLAGARQAGGWTGSVNVAVGTITAGVFDADDWDGDSIGTPTFSTITPSAGTYLMVASGQNISSLGLLSTRVVRNAAAIPQTFESHATGGTFTAYCTHAVLQKTNGAQNFAVHHYQLSPSGTCLIYNQLQICGVR